MRINTIILVITCANVVMARNDDRESRIVQTAQGPVKGYKSDVGDMYEFFGIHYATAPTGTHRFTAPLPGPKWMHTLEATEKNIVCPQALSAYLPDVKMQENCLIANIRVPDTDQTDLPVYVYVHGGAYLLGYGEMISPASLVKNKIITVTFNYRLGVHGFLCLGTEDAPGNAGMKDQVALLRWVRENIANFGGNPNDVTIAGGSAGASAVELLMLSDMTKDLFTKVIPESGSGLSAWSVQMDPVEYAKDYAKIKNVSNVDDIVALQEYYKTVSFDELAIQGLLLKLDATFHFTPCVERDLGQEMFLKEAPVNIIKQRNYRKVPVLYGFSNMEGLFHIQYFDARKDKMNENFADFLPADLEFNSAHEKNRVAKTVKEFYFGDKPVSETTVQGYIDYYTDVMFAYGYLRSVQLQVEAGSSSIYLYEYSLYSPLSQSLYPDFLKDVHGAGHGEYALALYDTNFSYIFGDSDAHKRMKSALREMWVNFITTGKPVPEGSELPAWPPVGANRSPHMVLGEEIKLGGPLLETRARFWDDIYKQYSRIPVPPKPFPVRSRNDL